MMRATKNSSGWNYGKKSDGLEEILHSCYRPDDDHMTFHFKEAEQAIRAWAVSQLPEKKEGISNAFEMNKLTPMQAHNQAIDAAKAALEMGKASPRTRRKDNG